MAETIIAKKQIRHPEKIGRADNKIPRKPDWIRVKAPTGDVVKQTRNTLRNLHLTTVCEEAACPNIAECWAKKHATFMIMGDTCTRACGFCNIITGKPDALDSFEPMRVAQAIANLKLNHAVITSVDRDDLKDGGAEHFIKTIQAVRKLTPNTTIEILTPDFRDKPDVSEVFLHNPPDVFNHNLETVPRLYPEIRPGARYFGSLALLANIKNKNPRVFTKSGLMVGLGESAHEVHQVMDDLRSANVDFLTIGQYLQPTPKHAALEKFWTPAEFEALAKVARGKGFLLVSASPLTRSSYHADADFQRLQTARNKQQDN